MKENDVISASKNDISVECSLTSSNWFHFSKCETRFVFCVCVGNIMIIPLVMGGSFIYLQF